jgi:hypothetical protein
MLKMLFTIISIMGVLMVFATAIQANKTDPKVIMKTSMGDITIELYPDKAPITVKNFFSYVDEKFYDGTIFHRVMKGFMIQGGGLTPEFGSKPAKSAIKNEATNGLKNKRGTIAMARLTMWTILVLTTATLLLKDMGMPFSERLSKVWTSLMP